MANGRRDYNIAPCKPDCSKPPTYLFVLPWSIDHLGGVNQVVINLAREMAKSGSFNPVVLVADWESVFPKWEEINGLKIVRWRIFPYHAIAGVKERLHFAFWEWLFRPAFKRFCDSLNVSVVNVHYPISSALTLKRIIDRFKKHITLILSFHGADVSSLRTLPATELAQWRRLVFRGGKVVVCSDDLGKKIVGLLGQGVNPHVIHNGLDAERFLALSTFEKLTPQRTILNVARFEHKKGQDVLVQAFAAIANDYSDLKLVLVGVTDHALESLQEMCTRMGVGSRVLFFPDTPHHQVADFFRRATIFVLPSRQEPFGIVLLEAGAFGLPVVASRVGGIPEILTDGLTGRLVAPDDPVKLADCLRSILDFPNAAHEMGCRLQHHVFANFTWTTSYKKYVALVEEAHGSGLG